MLQPGILPCNTGKKAPFRIQISRQKKKERNSHTKEKFHGSLDEHGRAFKMAC